jgi:Tfp pilus assembly protein PilE
MKKNKGITMIVLVITIALLLILAGISIQGGGSIIKRADLENLKTDMLLIKVKGKENANFNLGTSFDKLTDETEKSKRIEMAKSKLKGTEIQNASELSKFGVTSDQFEREKNNLNLYYTLSTSDLEEIGMQDVSSKGQYIIKYNIKDMTIEIYNTQGFENGDKTYYSLSELENLEIN